MNNLLKSIFILINAVIDIVADNTQTNSKELGS